VIGVLDFGEKETYAFVGRHFESMGKKIRFNLLVRGEGSTWIPCKHMELMPLFAELMAEVIRNPAGSADGIRGKNIG
jgi:di/tripeptidase